MAKERKIKRPKLNFAEEFFPARPSKLVAKARQAATKQLDIMSRLGLPIAGNPAYISWLRRESMLSEANKLARKYSGKGSMWQNPFAHPRPRSAVKQASVWYTAYPISMITKPGKSILATFGDPELWDVFQKIGITAVHTGPMKRAGGVDGWKLTPSIDGHFDRISTKIDPLFGTENEFRAMSETAREHGGIIIDDIVPGHTGKGPDFRLAEMGVGEYPGIYHMVEIQKEDWPLLPVVPKGKSSVNISAETEALLKKKGYIIGKLQRIIFYEPGVKETNWSATKVVRGLDGIKRRWVYLHYFKDGQPSLNWLDPSFAGMKLVIGDALHSIGELGTKALRLDANGFLGAERIEDEEHAWSEGHPLSGAANQLISGMVRKLGGFTFQELNLSMDDIKATSDLGADLSYDFVDRPAYHHALATADTEFLRLTLREALKLGIDPASLVHALQNHDELTHELVHFWTIHKDDAYDFRGKTVKGLKLRDIIRHELNTKLTDKISYNLPFTENGIACTTASVIAATLGYTSIDNLNSEQLETIKKAHLLLAMFNALQPGVFALSGWDLSGSLPLKKSTVEHLIADGDTRWINRGAYDLMDYEPESTASASGMPKTINLYGSLPNQMKDKNSFALRLKKILELRDVYSIATAHQIDIPETSHKSLLAMVHKLPEGEIQVTMLNFSNKPAAGSIRSEYFEPQSVLIDMSSDRNVATVSAKQAFSIELQPFEGMSFLQSK